MKINSEHWLETEAGEGWQFEVKKSPNSKPGLVPKKIIIANTNFARMEDAVRAYEQPGARSYHLVLGKNGQDLVQLVPFDHQARSTFGFEADSIAITLDYLPKTSEGADLQGHIITVAGNNRHVKVPVFPKEQLDGLLELLVILCKNLGLKTIHAISELFPQGSMPGPAFPLTQLRERLFERTKGDTGGLIVLEQIVQDTVLHNAPSSEEPSIISQQLQPGTPVSISEDWKDWVRVEVLQETEGNLWLVGWVEARKVETMDYEPEVRDNYLFATDGRQYSFIPAVKGNYDHKNVMEHDDLLFIVMHTTTGVYLQSTINTFKNPKEGVSAHLVIGRDGRVVQMVPFNRVAYHVGGGYWEEQGGINWHSIGIEVDNAGKLTEKQDGTVGKGDVIIPEGQYERIRHWKDFWTKPWHTFPDIQLDVTFKVVKALEQHFRPIKEILEHERVNLITRRDPGDLFPMSKLRKEVLGRKKPAFKRWRVVRETKLYQNSNNQSPKSQYETWPKPLSDCEVKILNDECNYWLKIEIWKHKNKNWKGRKGWIRRDDVKLKEGKYHLTKEQDFYRDPGDKIRPPCLSMKQLPIKTEVRIQRTEKNKWCLVAIPDHEIGYLFLEGWVRKDDLELIQE